MRMHAAHFGEQRRKHVQADGHAADQANRAAQRVALLADGGDRFLEILKDAMTELEERLAGRRDADAPPDAVEDRLAELLLEEQNLAADRRLRDVQLLAGGGERAGVGDSPDDLQLPQIHGVSIL